MGEKKQIWGLFLNLEKSTCFPFIFFLFVKHTHTHIYIGEGDETREYTHTPTPKLHATVSVAEQVINPFSISHLTDVG